MILATKKFATEDRFKSWFYTISTLLFLVLSFIGALYSFPIAIRITCSLLTSLLLLRMFMLYHDFLHKAILKRSRIAQAIFTIYGLYTLNPPSIWKRSHDHHHKHNSKLHTSNIGSFPILCKEAFLELTKSERTNYLFIRHPLTIAAGYIFAFMWGMCMLSLIRNLGKHWDSALALIFHFGIGIGIFISFGWLSLLLAFLLPAIISSGFGSYLFYAQHNFPTSTFEDKENWTYAKAALQSSSYMKMNPVMHWFTGSIGYHHIHHINALIPFYRLKEVHQAFPEFKAAKTTSMNPIEMWRCLQIKVWDAEQNRMLKLNEIS